MALIYDIVLANYKHTGSKGMNHGNNPAPFDEQQLTRLGLLHQPFADESFQFEDATIEAERNLAVHLLQSSNRLVILSGPPGGGRSSFLRQVAAVHTDELDCCALAGSPQLRASHVAKMLAMRIGASETAHNPDTLAARLRQAEASGYRPALLIDDAHRLEENTIKGLLLLREAIAKTGGRLPLLLAAPTGAEHELLQLTASVADQGERSEITLPAFTETQTASYLDQSLAAAGEHTGQLLSARQKQQIHQQTQGIPAFINQETVRILMATTLKRDPARTPARRSRLLYAGVATAMILLASGLLLTRYLGEPQTTAEPGWNVPLALPSHPGRAPAHPVATQSDRVGADNAETTVAEASAPTRVTSPSSPEATQAPGAASTPNSGPMVAQRVPTEPRPAAPEGSPSTAAALLRQAPRLPLKALDSVGAMNTAPAKPAASADWQPEMIPPATEVSTANAATPVEAPAPTSQHSGAIGSTQVAAQSPAPSATSRLREDWSADRAGNHYTIQLIAGHEEQTLERFLNQHPLGNKAHVVQTRHGGRDWHVLITGDYPSRSAARNALNRLPQALRDNGIWVRSFASLRP